MTKDPVKFYSPCERCRCDTRHEVVCESVDSGTEHYQFRRSYSVIQCLGCEGKSFRYLFEDIENSYPIDEDEWVTPEDVQYYPKFHVGHDTIENHVLPEIVREMYNETMRAIQEDALMLAGLGLRATIEAVCNDRKISGRNLESRITKMASQGLISVKDSERLHAIRFLGNDAAHDIKRPNAEQISVALKIVNHMVQSVYLLELEVTGKLDTIVTGVEELKKILESKLLSFSSGDEIPLVAILGKDVRRLGAGASQLETQLLSVIQSGDFPKLRIGKTDTFAGSKQSMQHFIVV